MEVRSWSKLLANRLMVSHYKGKEVRRMIESVNLLALLVAALASMGIGFLWYSPFLLGKPWMKLMGYSESDLKAAQKEMGTGYLLSLIATIVTVFVLAQVFNWIVPNTLTTALVVSLMLWIGFIAPVQFSDVVFGRKPMNLYLINTGYQLVSVLVMGTILFYLR